MESVIILKNINIYIRPMKNNIFTKTHKSTRHLYPNRGFTILLLLTIISITTIAQDSIICGSTVIIIRSPNFGVLVGADSRGEAMGHVIDYPICKIHQIGDLLFTMTGTWKMGKMFDVLANANEAYSYEAPFDTIVARFQRITVTTLLAKMNQMLRDTPDFVRQKYTNQSLLNGVFIGTRNDSIVYHNTNFSVFLDSNDSATVKFTEDICPGNCNDGYGLLFLGQVDTILQAIGVGDTTTIFNRYALDEAIRYLIRLECLKHPDIVAEPIYIALYCNSGIVWLSKEPVCKNAPDW